MEREDIAALVERSSFGEDEARQARARVPVEDAQAVLARIGAEKDRRR